jgi:hypothetical protein
MQRQRSVSTVSATLVEHCCYFRRSDGVLVGGHRNLRGPSAVMLTREGMMFDYIAKGGKRRAITVTDEVVLPTVRALAHSDNGLDTLFSYQHGGSWRILHSHDVSNYIAARAGGHFTAKEFRTWNATVRPSHIRA